MPVDESWTVVPRPAPRRRDRRLTPEQILEAARKLSGYTAEQLRAGTVTYVGGWGGRLKALEFSIPVGDLDEVANYPPIPDDDWPPILDQRGPRDGHRPTAELPPWPLTGVPDDLPLPGARDPQE